MNDYQHAYWECCIRFTADQIGLRDRQIELSRNSSDHHTIASVWTESRNNASVIYLRELQWFALPAWEQRQYVLHELLHIHFQQREDYIRRLIGGKNGDDESLILRLVNDDTERMTDDFSVWFAPAFYLPDEWFSTFSSEEAINEYAKRRQNGYFPAQGTAPTRAKTSSSS